MVRTHQDLVSSAIKKAFDVFDADTNLRKPHFLTNFRERRPDRHAVLDDLLRIEPPLLFENLLHGPVSREDHHLVAFRRQVLEDVRLAPPDHESGAAQAQVQVVLIARPGELAPESALKRGRVSVHELPVGPGEGRRLEAFQDVVELRGPVRDRRARQHQDVLDVFVQTTLAQDGLGPLCFRILKKMEFIDYHGVERMQGQDVLPVLPDQEVVADHDGLSRLREFLAVEHGYGIRAFPSPHLQLPAPVQAKAGRANNQQGAPAQFVRQAACLCALAEAWLIRQNHGPAARSELIGHELDPGLLVGI